jgi:hypothetical protein
VETFPTSNPNGKQEEWLPSTGYDMLGVLLIYHNNEILLIN